jgi:hypothetical protein
LAGGARTLKSIVLNFSQKAQNVRKERSIATLAQSPASLAGGEMSATDALGAEKIFLFEGFRLDRGAGCLFRADGSGTQVPVAMGSRALDLLVRS